MVILVYFAIVACSVVQSASGKLFNRYSDNSTAFNAVKATSALVLFFLMAVPNFSFHLPTLLFSLVYGLCLCASMYAGYRAICIGPMALTSMLVSFSLVLPLLWGLTVGEETLSPVRSVALVLLLFAILLINWDKLFPKRAQKEASEEKRRYGLWLFLVGVAFFANGVCSILQKMHGTRYSDIYSEEFMLFAMLPCSVIFCAVALYRQRPTQIQNEPKLWLGALAGTTNGLANFLTLTLAGLENATVLFPVISAGTLLGALLCGRFVFKEKLRYPHYAALLFGMLAVVLLKL